MSDQLISISSKTQCRADTLLCLLTGRRNQVIDKDAPLSYC